MANSRTDAPALDALATDLHGRLVRPGDGDYDDARAVWNGMIDRRPAAIARVTGVADVRRAVAVAREADLPLAVRGGGHNVAGTAVCDDGLVVDCSRMTAVRVDPEGPRAWVQGGATWADVDHETQAFGLAAPGGVVSDTGVAGLTLGGGIGHLRRAHGLSCDTLRAVELVTADGDVLRAGPGDHPELFWGLRGGPAALGVVTAFEFDLHPVGPEVATCLTFYPGDQVEAVLAGYREACSEAPPAVSTLAFAGELPDEELFDGGSLHEQKIAVMGCYAGPPDAGEAALEPFRTLGDPLADVSGRRPYAEFQQLLDADYPDGMRYYWKSLYLEGLPEAALERISSWAGAAPSALSTVDVWQLGGAIADVDADATAFPAREAPYLLGVEANWEDPAADEANVAWVRDCLADLRAFSDGATYWNFPGFHEDAGDMVAATFGPAADRLVALKDRYDPTDLFGGQVRPSDAG